MDIKDKVDIKDKLVEKSIEAFIVGLELYNKPTIKYRIEGFSFFIVNAWELMLKAELLNRKLSVYYNNTERTLSIKDTIEKIYTDKHTRIRQNLEAIIDLRNIGTHFITEDYEIAYAPLFQACVFNFIKEINRFHDKDITDYISQNFLTLNTSMNILNDEQIKIKYPNEIANKLIFKNNEISSLTKEYGSDKYAINVKHNLYITKDKKEADYIIKIGSRTTDTIKIVKEIKDASKTHPHKYTTVIKLVSDIIRKNNIDIKYKHGFNQHILHCFIKFYNVKEEEKYCFKHVIEGKINYTYSQQLVEFVIDEIKKNPDKFVETIRKKITPGT